MDQPILYEKEEFKDLDITINGFMAYGNNEINIFIKNIFYRLCQKCKNTFKIMNNNKNFFNDWKSVG